MRELGIDPALGVPASALGDAYMAMGAQLSFTCAPYLLDSAPKAGEQIVWAESNAVVYANSVLGARTLKYPDYLDICIALTGRAPLIGCMRVWPWARARWSPYRPCSASVVGISVVAWGLC